MNHYQDDEHFIGPRLPTHHPRYLDWLINNGSEIVVDLAGSDPDTVTLSFVFPRHAVQSAYSPRTTDDTSRRLIESIVHEFRWKFFRTDAEPDSPFDVTYDEFCAAKGDFDVIKNNMVIL